jgi:hypothetical protein
MGDAATLGGDTGAMSDLYSGALPVLGSVAWRFTPHLAVGAYGQYGLAFLASDAKDTFTDGTGRDLRVGLEASWAFDASGSVTPWIGLAAGWEWAQILWSVGDTDVTTTFAGPDGTLRGGADWRFSDALSVGPFASLSIGQFRSMESEGGGVSATHDLPSSERELHGWFQIGVRGRFDLLK